MSKISPVQIGDEQRFAELKKQARRYPKPGLEKRRDKCLQRTANDETKLAGKRGIVASGVPKGSVRIPGQNRNLMGMGSGTAEKTEPARAPPKEKETTAQADDSDDSSDLMMVF